MPIERCEQCRFSRYLKGLIGGKTYYCHRYPPYPIREVSFDGTAEKSVKSIRPQVDADGWCGEFQPLLNE